MNFPGGMCKSVTDWKRNEHEADPFRIYAKPCSEKRYYLCEGKEAFLELVVSFAQNQKQMCVNNYF